MSENTKLVPKRRFKEFQNAGDWEQRKLGEIAEIISGGTPDTNNSDYWDGDINWYAPAEISDQIYVTESERKITELGLQKSSAKMLPADKTILFTSRAGIGKTAILKHSACTNQGFQSLVLKDKYVPYFVYSMGEQIKVKAEAVASGSTFLEISGKMLSNIDVMIPKKDEQLRIASYFEQLDNLITLHQRKLEKTKSLKSTYLSEMFPIEGEREPKRRFAGFTDTWAQLVLGDMGKTFTGLFGKTKEDFGHGDAKFITYMNVFSNPIADPYGTENVENDNKQSEVKYGDVLFTTSSETPEEVGMSSVWLENTANVYLNSFCFGYRSTAGLDPYYLAFMLRSSAVRKKFIFLAQGISRYNISKNKVLEMNVPVPSLDEQRKVGAFFRKLDTLITLQQRKLEKLQNIKKAFLIEMFI